MISGAPADGVTHREIGDRPSADSDMRDAVNQTALLSTTNFLRQAN